MRWNKKFLDNETIIGQKKLVDTKKIASQTTCKFLMTPLSTCQTSIPGSEYSEYKLEKNDQGLIV